MQSGTYRIDWEKKRVFVHHNQDVYSSLPFGVIHRKKEHIRQHAKSKPTMLCYLIALDEAMDNGYTPSDEPGEE